MEHAPTIGALCGGRLAKAKGVRYGPPTGTTGRMCTTYWPARMTPGIRVIPTRSNPNRLFAAERGRAGVVGNTGSLGRLYSAETAETALLCFENSNHTVSPLRVTIVT